MYIVDRGLDFEHPAEKVWQVLTDFDNWGEWSEGQTFMRKVKFHFKRAEGSLPGPGMKVVAETGGKFAHTLVAEEWNKPKFIKFVVADPGPTDGFQFWMSWTLTPVSSIKTHLDLHIEFDLAIPGWLKAFVPVQKFAEKKVDAINARALKFF